MKCPYVDICENIILKTKQGFAEHMHRHEHLPYRCHICDKDDILDQMQGMQGDQGKKGQELKKTEVFETQIDSSCQTAAATDRPTVKKSGENLAHFRDHQELRRHLKKHHKIQNYKYTKAIFGQKE